MAVTYKMFPSFPQYYWKPSFSQFIFIANYSKMFHEHLCNYVTDWQIQWSFSPNLQDIINPKPL